MSGLVEGSAVDRALTSDPTRREVQGLRRRTAIPESGNRKLCQVCEPDGRIVAEVSAALKAAAQPPLSVPVPAGSPLQKLRTRGLKAQARLDGRRRGSKQPAPAATTSKKGSTSQRAAASSTPRRLSAQEKHAGARRLRARMDGIERRLRQEGTMRHTPGPGLRKN